MNQKPEVKYPVTVKFDSVNYANVNTNGYALWEARRSVASFGDCGPVGLCVCHVCITMWLVDRTQNTQSCYVFTKE